MIFNSNIFLFAFLPIVFTVFWLSTTKQLRYVLMTIAGYVFYGYWDWRFCFLLLFSSLVSFFAALLIERSPGLRGRRWWMALSVGADLALLGFFKYYNFFASSVHAVMPVFAPPVLHIVLPVGISFYTFHTISYIVDVADGRIRATRNLFEYLTYVSLFSQLVAGPIVRFREIEGDLEHIDGRPRTDFMAQGVGFFVIGLIKKAVVADSIAMYLNPVLASYGTLSTAGAWLAALGYTFQIYYDFSGYSDMAIGLGYLFGFRIPQNFNAPYRAVGPRDFWRRWHMSLSSWLRDYLYIRLGGNRLGGTRMKVNLLVTMLLGGLWHGANWTFVLWGAYHGVLLIVERACDPWLVRVPEAWRRAGTFVLVVFSWVLFRSDSLGMAGQWMARMLGSGAGTQGVPPPLVALVALCLVTVNTLPETWDIRFGTRYRWAPVYALGFFFAYLFVNGRNSPFLYYQF